MSPRVPIRPRRLQREHDAPIVEEPEAVLRHGRPQQIATELLEPCAVGGRRLDVGVQIKPPEMRVPRRGREHPGRVRVGAHAPDARPCPRPERDAPLDRGAADPGQRGRVRDHRIGLAPLRVAGIEPAAPEQALHARGDRASTTATSSSVGGDNGRKSSVPVGPAAKKTPSNSTVW